MRVSAGSITWSTNPRSDAGQGFKKASSYPVSRSALSAGSIPRCRICTAPDAPMTAISAAGPGQADVVADPAGVHDDVRAPEGLAQDQADPGHGGLGVGEGELRPVADHPPPFEVLAGQETGRVHQAHDGQVERIAEADEPGRLLRRRDVQGAGEDPGLVGHDPDREPPDVAQARDDLTGPAGPQLEELAVVDHVADDVAHVVGRGLAFGDQLAQLGGGAQHAGR